MKVQLNGEGKEIADGLTVEMLLQRYRLKAEMVVVELNREIMDRKRYPNTPLSEGDEIEIVRLVGGGEVRA